MREIERVQTVVIGAGQAGLSVGYHLARRGEPFVILDAHGRVGDSWRTRWDSLRLFTPARLDGIDGMPFPARPDAFPSKDEMADFLEGYAGRHALPVRTGVRVERVARRGERFLLETSGGAIEAEQVVVAMANYQKPRVPAFAPELDPSIVQLHSADYRNPSQLRAGSVLVVGAGNSGAEIGIELVRQGWKTTVAGRVPGQLPFRIGSWIGRNVLAPFMLRFVFHRVLTLSTPVGRKAHAGASHNTPLIRVKERDLVEAGVERAGRVVAVRGGRPVLDDDRVMDVANVVWCTGFEPGFSWIDLPVFGADGAPVHERGVSTREPGLYFVGLHFLYALSSTMIHGVGRDAEHVAGIVARRRRELGAQAPVAGGTVRQAGGVGAPAA